MLLGRRTAQEDEEEEEEDDTHLCIRCNAKIIGLENYVEHRKSFCSTTKLINKTTTSTITSGGGGSGGRQRAETAQNGGTTLVGADIEEEQQKQQAILQKADEDDDDEGTPSASPMVAMSMRPVKPSPGTAINNQDQLKFKAPFTGSGSDYGKSPERRGRGGTATAGDGFPNFTVVESNYSKTVLDKSLEFNLDYDNEFEVVDNHPSSSSASSVVGTASAAEVQTDVHEYENLFFSSLQLQSSSKTPKRPLDDTVHHHHPEGGGKSARSGDAENIPGIRTASLYELDVGVSSEEEDEDEDETEEEFYLEELEYESEMDDEFEENFRAPPRSHTGGKWKPDDRPLATIRSSATITTAAIGGGGGGGGGDVVNENFMWSEAKPSASSAEDVIVIMDETEDDFPPQDYTRGKWVPGGGGGERGGTSISRRSSESPIKEQISAADYRTMATSGGGGEQTGNKSIWCSVCNRTLASEPIFERHLTSNIHKERALMETELEQGRTFPEGGSGDSISSTRQSRGPVMPGRSIKRTASHAEGVVISAEEESSTGGKRKSNLADDWHSFAPGSSSSSIAHRVKQVTEVGARKRSQSAILTSSCPSSTVVVADKQSKQNQKKKKRDRRHIFTDCAACKVRLPIALMGRHLLSHMHYRRMQLSRAQDQNIVFTYLDQIVRLSPFQCQICRFSATTQELFMQHWYSNQHKTRVQEAEVQRMWCSFCKYEGSVDGMERHLLSQAHQEVIDALNKTYPIVIRQKTDLGCVTCGKAFHTNMAIRKHKCDGGGGGGQMKVFVDTASDEYQSIFKCEHCDQVFRKLHKLKRHNAEMHSQGKTYQCFTCVLVFLTEKEALKHRGSLEHKVTAAKLRGRKFAKRTCRQCTLEFEDPLQLRNHVQEMHKAVGFSCLLCGAKFQVSQALSHHVKQKLCGRIYPEEDQEKEKKINVWACEKLISSSCPMCSYQSNSESEMLLHKALLHDHPELAYDTQAKVPCPLCSKSFVKASLIGHLRRHTNERPFACPDCPSSYTRKANLVDHMPKCRGRGDTTTTNAPVEKAKKGTSGRFACKETGCKYKTTREQNLRKHAVVHKEKRFACDKCGYKASEMRFLKKHSMVHTREQPYTCPECQKGFSCISNMRKHFMSAHGAENALYKCGECRFTTNYRADLKLHNCLRYK